MKLTSLIPVLSLVAASPLAVNSDATKSTAVQPLSVDSTQIDCTWTGYGGTGFTKSYGTIGGYFGTCYSMPDSRWTQKLFSAKVQSGGSICLRTSGSCGGGSQTIDSAGYRDMSSLPAYYTWYCGAC